MGQRIHRGSPRAYAGVLRGAAIGIGGSWPCAPAKSNSSACILYWYDLQRPADSRSLYRSASGLSRFRLKVRYKQSHPRLALGDASASRVDDHLHHRIHPRDHSDDRRHPLSSVCLVCPAALDILFQFDLNRRPRTGSVPESAHQNVFSARDHSSVLSCRRLCRLSHRMLDSGCVHGSLPDLHRLGICCSRFRS